MEPPGEVMSDRETRQRGYRALLERAGGDALALASLARLMHADGLAAEAATLARRARSAAPGHAQVQALARGTLSADVPPWHFHMLRDTVRNAAYEAALRRGVTPGSRVLEIGTGSGILAMMAARAGAGHVTTCEAIPAIAEAARDVIALNGLADRITVVTGHSSALSPADLGGPADVLVSEIVSNDLLSEAVLPALADAVGRLVVRGGAIIPAAGLLRVALARDSGLDDRRLGVIHGFDLSPFNRLAKPFHPVPAESPRLTLCSEAASLFRFDFSGGGPWPTPAATVDLAATREGANGVAQWICLEMDGSGRYENRPGTLSRSSWGVRFFPFHDEPDGPAGAARRVHGRHETTWVRIWSEELGAGPGG